MKVICDKCGWEREYDNNVYGTWCPKCNNFIPSGTEPNFVVSSKLKLKELQQIFLKKLKKSLFREK